MTILVPYRDRPKMLETFAPAISRYLPRAKIYIIEQTPGQKFNRAKLFNAGFLLYPDGEYYCFHDIDHIPVNVDYSFPAQPTQLAKSNIQTQGYFGGVTMLNRKDFVFINGYSNEFWGYGGEDNFLWFNVLRHGLTPVNRFGKFNVIDHAKNGVVFNQARWMQAQLPMAKTDGLTGCKYTVIKSEKILTNVIKTTVEL